MFRPIDKNMLNMKKISLAITFVASILFVDIAFAQMANTQGVLTNGAPTSFAPLVEAAAPAVVNISTTQSIDVKSPFDELRMEIPEGSPFEQLFKDFLDRDYGLPSGRKRKAISLGSGFIIDPEGYIVTNYHVVESADEINVTLSNDTNKNYTAKVIGVDKKTDLALLKIESKEKLPYLKFGDANASKVGDWIIAIGNPFGFGGTVTAGIISAKSRFIPGQYDEYIQTDASINRGNSGGPLFNMSGEVIGINSFIISPSGGNIGIGFAVPSNQAQIILKQLREKGQITRGWLGVGIQPVTEEMAKNLGLDSAKGVIVSEVMKDSPAEKAGIKPGDIILAFDTTQINQPQKLSKLVAETVVGKQSVIEILRDDKVMKINVTIAKLDTKADEAPTKSKDQGTADYYLGMKFDNIDATIRQKYKIDESIKGVLISRVNRGSVAGDIGIKAGDVLMQINKKKVNNVNEVLAELKRAKTLGSKNVVMFINRAGSNRFVEMDLE